MLVGLLSVAGIAAAPSVAATPAPEPSASHATETFGYTGAVQTFTVPPHVRSLSVVAIGARGGRGASGYDKSGGGGGLAARVSADLDVNPGEALLVVVGGPGGAGGTFSSGSGGFNGGARAGHVGGGGGGGASDIRTGGQPGPRLVVAAGGGGGGAAGAEGPGGPGGLPGQAGHDGHSSPHDPLTCHGRGGGGAGPTAGGGGGGGCVGADQHGDGGSLGQGGIGGASGVLESGGGGGGGTYGGGGGGAGVGGSGAGGGGGSSAVTPPATNARTSVSDSTAPLVTISYDHSVGVDLDVSPHSPVNEGHPITLTAKVYGPVQHVPATFLAARCQPNGLCEPPFDVGTSEVGQDAAAVVTVTDLPADSCYGFYVSYAGVGDRSFDELGCFDVRPASTSTTRPSGSTTSGPTTSTSEGPPAS